MKKKVLAIMLTVAMLATMITVATVSVSAKTNADGTYTKTDETTETYRYFFVLPDEWLNTYTAETGDSVGIYWFDGTDSCGSLADPNAGPAWPGYKAYKAGDSKVNLWYCDVPTDVTTVIFNNYVDGGTDKSDPKFLAATQTVNIGSEYYDAGENEHYPDGTANFNNMCFVVDPENKQESPVTPGKFTYGGEWMYYHNEGVFDYNAEGEEPTETPGPTTPTDPTSTTAATTVTEATTATGDASTPTAATGATSKVSTADTAATTASNNNGTVATNDSSSAILLLVALLGVTSVMIAIRKKDHE